MDHMIQIWDYWLLSKKVNYTNYSLGNQKYDYLVEPNKGTQGKEEEKERKQEQKQKQNQK